LLGNDGCYSSSNWFYGGYCNGCDYDFVNLNETCGGGGDSGFYCPPGYDCPSAAEVTGNGTGGGTSQLAQLSRAETLLSFALLSPSCSNVVDGGTGAAVSLLASMEANSALGLVGAISVTDSPPVPWTPGQTAQTSFTLYPRQPNGVSGGAGPPANTYLNPNGPFFNGYPPSSLPGLTFGERQAVTLGHELGHAIVMNGGVSAMVEDENSGELVNYLLSSINSARVAGACFGYSGPAVPSPAGP
jgi:hypothetical protein